MKNYSFRSMLAFSLALIVFFLFFCSPAYASPITESEPISPPEGSTVDLSEYNDSVFDIYKLLRTVALTFLGFSIAKVGMSIFKSLLTARTGEEFKDGLKTLFTLASATLALFLLPTMISEAQSLAQPYAWAPPDPVAWYETKPPEDEFFGDENYQSTGGLSSSDAGSRDPLSSSTSTTSLNISAGVHAESNKLKSYVFVPENATEDMALFIYLHGAGEKGSDSAAKTGGVAKCIKTVFGENQQPFILYQPILSSGSWSSDSTAALLKSDIDAIVSKYKIDSSRIIISGFSLGSYGTWKMVSNYGGFFSAAIPIAGHNVSADGTNEFSMNYNNAKNVAVTAYIGTNDVCYGWYGSGMKDLVDNINYHGGRAEYIEIPGLGHYTDPALNYVFGKATIYDWALSQ